MFDALKSKITQWLEHRQAKKAVRDVKAILNSAEKCHQEKLLEALALYQQAFERLEHYDRSQETWNRALDSLIECLRLLASLLQESKSLEQVEPAFQKIHELFFKYSDFLEVKTQGVSNHPGQYIKYQQGILSYVNAHVSLANDSEELKKQELCGNRAIKIMNAANIRPADPNIREDAQRAFKQLSLLYQAVGDEYSASNQDEKARANYETTWKLLEYCDQKQSEVQKIWNDTIQRELTIHARSEEEIKSCDEKLIQLCEKTLTDLKEPLGNNHDGSLSNQRLQIVETMMKAAIRMTGSATSPETKKASAEDCVRTMSYLKDSQVDLKKDMVDQLTQLVVIKELDEKKGKTIRSIIRQMDGQRSGESTLTRWLKLCDDQIDQIHPTEKETPNQNAIRMTERLLSNLEFCSFQESGSEKRLGYRKVRCLVESKADATTIAEVAKESLTEITLGKTPNSPLLTLYIGMSSWPSLIKTDSERKFLRAERLMGLIDLVESQKQELKQSRHKNQTSLDRLEKFRKCLYRDYLRWEDYENSNYESVHTKPTGLRQTLESVIQASQIQAPLDYIYCLTLSEELFSSHRMQRGEELYQIVAKRFERRADESLLRTFRDRCKKIVDQVIPKDFSCACTLLEYLLPCDDKETSIDAYERLIKAYKEQATKECSEGKYKESTTNFQSALKYQEQCRDEFSLVNLFNDKLAHWNTEIQTLQQLLIDAHQQASKSCRSNDVNQANQHLLEALKYLKILDSEEQKRIEVLRGLQVGQGSLFSLDRADAQLSLKHGLKLLPLNVQSGDISQYLWDVKHFLSLANLGGICDDVEFHFLLGETYYKHKKYDEAKKSFLKVVKVVADSGKNIDPKTADRIGISSYYLSEIEFSKVSCSNNDIENNDLLTTAADHLHRALQSPKCEGRWFSRLVDIYQKKASLKSRPEEERQNDDLQALNVISQWRIHLKAKGQLQTKVDEAHQQILTKLSKTNIEKIELESEDAQYCSRYADQLINKKGKPEEVCSILKLAERGDAISPGEFEYKMGCAYQKHEDWSEAQSRFLQTVETEGAERSLCSNAYYELGKIELSLTAQKIPLQDRIDGIKAASDYFEKSLTETLDKGQVYEALGDCYTSLNHLYQQDPNSEEFVLSSTLINNERMRSAFEYYDLAYKENASRAKVLKDKIAQLGGGMGYLMIASVVRGKSNDQKNSGKVIEYLKQCQKVFPESAASRLAKIIASRAYSPVNVSDHDLPLRHFQLAQHCFECGMLSYSDFLFKESRYWFQQLEESSNSKVDKILLESYLNQTEDLIKHRSRDLGCLPENVEPDAASLQWEELGSNKEVVRNAFSKTLEVIKKIPSWIPTGGTLTAIKTSAHLFNVLFPSPDNPTESAKLQKNTVRDCSVNSLERRD